MNDDALRANDAGEFDEGIEELMSASESADDTDEVTVSREEWDAVNEQAARADEYYNTMLRKAADFENLRRRTAKEKVELQAQLLPIHDILGIADNLERAIAAAREAQENSATLDGICMVHQQVVEMLRRRGVERIDAVGKPFDPRMHEAVMALPDANLEPNTVQSEIQAGYAAGERVLRPSRVVVSTAPPATQETNETETEPNDSPTDENPSE